MTPDKFYYRQNLDQEFYTATKALTDLTLRVEKTKLELPALKATVAAAQARHDEMLSAISHWRVYFAGPGKKGSPQKKPHPRASARIVLHECGTFTRFTQAASG